MEEFVKAVGNFGFPIVVAAYLLFRQEKKTEELARAIEQNTIATRELKSIIEQKIK